MTHKARNTGMTSTPWTIGGLRRLSAFGFILQIALGISGCERAAPPSEPVSAPYPDPLPSRVVEEGRYPLVEHVTPAETLFVYPQAPRSGASLLFFRGRGVTRDSAGNGYIPQESAGRVLVVGPELRVVRTVGGPSANSGAIGMPLSVAATPAGATYVVDVESSDGLLYFDEQGVFRGSAEPPVLNGSIAVGPGGEVWAARSPYIFGFEPTPPGSPLLYRFDPLAGKGSGIAEIEPISPPVLNRLANAGAVAVGSDGTAYFAFLLRNELRAYRPDGDLVWRSARVLHFSPSVPSLGEGEGAATLHVTPVTQAVAVGPVGLVYALTATDSAANSSDPAGPRGHRRLEVYRADDGSLLRATLVPAAWTSFAVSRAGRVFRVDERALLNSAPPPERRALPDIALESFTGDTVRFRDFRGKALLVNVWASWCTPCRRELPQLGRLYASLDRGRVEFLAISDDTDEASARSFADSLGLPFPLFLGHGRMRDRFRYPGLPYTIVADYRGRVVEEFFGFGSPESWERLTRALGREIERAAPPDSAPVVGRPIERTARTLRPGERKRKREG